MANKRMFSNDILNNDEFIEMPAEAQMLYVRLNMEADDRGICDGPRNVMRQCGASNDSMKLLIAKKFVILPTCKPSVVVIKHWWVNNNVRKERFKETKHTDVMRELFYDSNKSYSQNPNDGHISCISNGRLVWPTDVPALMETPQQYFGYPTDNQSAPNVHPTDDQWVPQNRIDKSRVDKSRVDKNNNTSLLGSTGNRGLGEEPETAAAVPVPDPEKKRERIDYFVQRLRFFEEQRWSSAGLYALAESEGIKRSEIELRKMQLEKQKEMELPKPPEDGA